MNLSLSFTLHLDLHNMMLLGARNHSTLSNTLPTASHKRLRFLLQPINHLLITSRCRGRNSRLDRRSQVRELLQILLVRCSCSCCGRVRRILLPLLLLFLSLRPFVTHRPHKRRHLPAQHLPDRIIPHRRRDAEFYDRRRQFGNLLPQRSTPGSTPITTAGSASKLQ